MEQQESVQRQKPVQVKPAPVQTHMQNNEQEPPIEVQPPLVQLRRTEIVMCKLGRYVLLGKSYQVITIDNENDSINYNKILKDVDAHKLHKARC